MQRRRCALAAAKPKTQRIGRQTPTRSVTLPYTETLGKEAVDLYEQTGRTAFEWQRLLLYDILATNKDGLWVHTKYGYAVPRRNGKNEIVVMRELFALKQGERVLHTAHRTTTSHAAWERLCSMLDHAKVDYKSIRASGRETVWLPDGGRVDFRTRSSKGGLGEGFDLLIIDEAQEYTDDQESALKYVVSDSDNPQTLYCGTPPTPVSSGVVFLHLRRAALQGHAENTGWAEWSVEQQTDPNNVDAWYETNPSLGAKLTERSIRDEIGEDVVDFNIQRLGLWLRYNQKSAISRGEWDALLTQSLPELTGGLYIGIKYGHDGKGVSMALAVHTTDGRLFCEVLDYRPVRAGIDWMLTFLRSADVAAVAVDGANGQELLTKGMRDVGLKAPDLPTVADVIAANAAFEQAVSDKSLCHAGQPSVVQIVSNCEHRAIGSRGGFGYRALLDGAAVELMESMALAYWLAANAKAKRPQRVAC